MKDGWAGILDADEDVLWQGQPEPGVRFEWRKRSTPIFFAFFTAVSIFLMFQLAQEGGFGWIFMMPFFLIGIYNLIIVHYWDDYVRRHTHYTITSKRAIIATEIMARRTLKSYPLMSNDEVVLEERSGLTDIYFAEKLHVYQDDRRDGIRATRTAVRKIGFRHLRDGRKVYETLREAQSLQAGGEA